MYIKQPKLILLFKKTYCPNMTKIGRWRGGRGEGHGNTNNSEALSSCGVV